MVAQELVSRLVQADQSAALATILAVLELESEARHERRVTRLRRASRLPTAKTFETFDDKRLSRAVVHRLEELKLGEFVDKAVNILAFGLPGVGKSHAFAALGHSLVQQGRSVLWTPTYTIVQKLLAAKRDLDLPVIAQSESFPGTGGPHRECRVGGIDAQIGFRALCCAIGSCLRRSRRVPAKSLGGCKNHTGTLVAWTGRRAFLSAVDRSPGQPRDFLVVVDGPKTAGWTVTAA